MGSKLMNLNSGSKVGDYEVLELLGSGGMGSVYKVRNVISNRVEAMKVLLPNVDNHPDFKGRFVREIQLLATLDNVYIAKLYNALSIDNQLYMLMEFVEGRSVAKRLEDGPIAVSNAISYTMQVLLALGYAHELGIVHRDIKPANIIVTPQDMVKLVDFGIAKDMLDQSSRITKAEIPGSLHYMSPEQLNGGHVDHRSDLYSVGVSFYEMVTSRPPFQGSPAEVLLGHVKRDPVPPVDVNPTVMPALSDVILKAMNKQVDSRFQSAGEFFNCLESLLSGTHWEVSLGKARQSVGAVRGVQDPPTPVSRTGSAPSDWGSSLYFADSVTDSTDLLSTEPLQVVRQSQLAVPDDVRLGSRRSPWAVVAGGLLLVALLVSVYFWRQHSRHEQLSLGAGNGLPRLLRMSSGDMVLVDGGVSRLGADRHSVHSKPFYIDRTEVSNSAFAEFCRATHRAIPPIAIAKADLPVVNVTFAQATEFAHWAGKRLARADEWEKAARGAAGNRLPWGDALDLGRANIGHPGRGPESVESHLDGASPYGALNLVGNVWEWINEPAKPDPRQIANLRKQFLYLKPPLQSTEIYMQIRGGSFRDPIRPEDLPNFVWDFSAFPARAAAPEIGFRCVRNVPSK
jgi:serine/threonine-protein kinase